MRVIDVRGVNEALPRALQMMDEGGVRRGSRNGPVLWYPEPVTTVYRNPRERVLFWPQRDANPFFHAYEAMWMIDGRRDVAGPARYAKQMLEYSDDGVVLHGAYGYRWRYHFAVDQLRAITQALVVNPEDRRCVLQMWDADHDLGTPCRDVPCNTVATLQRGASGELNMTVFCRSNDIVWGAYGANAVHFSVLLEYMASEISCPVGVYRQVSDNWHAYLDTYEKLRGLPRPNPLYSPQHTPYARKVRPVMMAGVGRRDIQGVLECAETGKPFGGDHPWAVVMSRLMLAHWLWKNVPKEHAHRDASAVLKADVEASVDWAVAAQEWLDRREQARTQKEQF